MKRTIAIGGIVTTVAGLGVALAVTGSHHGVYGTSAKAAPSIAGSATVTRIGTSQTRLGPIRQRAGERGRVVRATRHHPPE